MSGTYAPGKKSTTDPEAKNRWATRWSTFNDAQRLYGRPIVWDVAAESMSCKCGDCAYFGPDHGVIAYRDSLREDLLWPADYWCNPPFDDKVDFILKARKMQELGRSGMFLLPYEPCSGWWQDLIAENVIIFEPDGRIGFYECDGVTKKDGVNFPSALICFPTQKIGQSVRVQYKRTFDARTPRKKKDVK